MFAYESFGTGFLAELGLKVFAAGGGELHDAVADYAWNDAAHGGERQEEWL